MKKISNQSKFIASSVAMILLLPACSNTISTKPEVATAKQSAFFEHFDTNKDLKVTADEFIEARSGRFKTDDKNGDGVLSRREYITASHARLRVRMAEQKLEKKNKYFAKMDADDDGTVDEKEFIASSQVRAKKTFAKMDTDKSGLINSDEYVSFSYKDSHKSMSRQSNPYKMFTEMDVNRNNQLSLEERNKARMKWFDSMDRNADKVVTPEEVAQAKEEREKKKANLGK